MNTIKILSASGVTQNLWSNSKKTFLFSLSAASLLALSLPASATLVNFDDVNNGTVLGNNYHGLNWLDTRVFTTNTFPGTAHLNVSLPSAATNYGYSVPVQISASTPFTFNSAYFVANYASGLQVTVNGVLNGILVDSASFTVDTSKAVLETFNWANVDTITIAGSGGTLPIGGDRSFSFDNVIVNGPVSSVPVPAAAWLLGSGLIGLTGVARKRNAA